MSGDDAHADAIAALERFVCENDELLELEQRIGRFNIFDALNIARVEIRHSSFLAWLLDPAESHGQGPLFLNAVLMDLLRQESAIGRRPFSPIELDGAKLRGVQVRREWRSIDILIACDDPAFVIAIENKVDSGEHGDQLHRYRETLDKAEEFRGRPKQYVFLTPEGDEPTHDDWVPYSYRDLHDVLRRVMSTNRGSLGDDVTAFLNHYLRLIGSRFMDDPDIDDLCQRIYKNHRQAIDLIVERVADVDADVVSVVSDLLSESEDAWHVLRRRPRLIEFQPVEWRRHLPRMNVSAETIDDLAYLSWYVEAYKSDIRFFIQFTPLDDVAIRRRVIDAVVKGVPALSTRGTPKDSWTRVYSKQVMKLRPDDAVDVDQVRGAVRRVLETAIAETAEVPAIVRATVHEPA